MYGYDKCSLFQMIEDMKRGDLAARDYCISFLIIETDGVWHGRARAKISRNLPANHVDTKTANQVVRAVGERLVSGRFSEQFKDQINLGLRLLPDLKLSFAKQGLISKKQYVRRYSNWTIERFGRMNAMRAPSTDKRK